MVALRLIFALDNVLEHDKCNPYGENGHCDKKIYIVIK